VKYKLGGEEVTEMPATYRAMEAIEPVYEMIPGWQTSTRGIARFDDLPSEARSYLRFLGGADGSRDRRGVDGPGAE
jgi:adenylosuccinate synthase